MFHNNSIRFNTGIALKRSIFSTKLEYIETILFADQFHNFVFLDYEGKDMLLTPEELDVLLAEITHKLILTISVRSPEFHQTRKYLLENYLRLTRSNSNITFCIVAGNPTYSSVDTRIPVYKAFHYVLSRIQKKTSMPIFLGIENQSSNLIDKFFYQYGNIIPFVLDNNSRTINLNKIPTPFAIYTPLTYSIPDNEAMKFLTSYLLSRNYTQQKLAKIGLSPIICSKKWLHLSPRVEKILLESFNKYILTSNNFESKTINFFKIGARLIVGFPAVQGKIHKIIENFRIKLIQKPIDPENSEINLNL